MYYLYAKKEDIWQKIDAFESSFGEYAELVKEGIARARKSDGESRRNAATVMEDFVLGKKYFSKSEGKIVLRALRHFDEVGVSNEIGECLEACLEEGYTYFALVYEGELPENYALGAISVRI